jgi:hypothetical protein
MLARKMLDMNAIRAPDQVTSIQTKGEDEAGEAHEQVHRGGKL